MFKIQGRKAANAIHKIWIRSEKMHVMRHVYTLGWKAMSLLQCDAENKTQGYNFKKEHADSSQCKENVKLLVDYESGQAICEKCNFN